MFCYSFATLFLFIADEISTGIDAMDGSIDFLESGRLQNSSYIRRPKSARISENSESLMTLGITFVFLTDHVLRFAITCPFGINLGNGT